MTRDEARALVSAEGWLAGRPQAFRDALFALAQLVKFRKGEVIYAVGDQIGGPYGLIEGSLRIEVTVEGIGAQVGFLAHPGIWLGAASAIRREPRELTLISASDTLLFHLPLSGFEQLVRDAENMRHFAVMTAENSSLAISAARDLMNPDIRGRIASRLLTIIGRREGSADEPPPRPVALTQADLAMICNVSRKTINQELAKLEDAGLVTLSYGKLVVRDVPGLRLVAGARPAK